MKERLRQRAAELGFDECRFTTAAPPATAEALQDWLSAGQHGEMAWLARNAGKRVNPQRVLAGVKSVIVVAASYSERRKAKGELRSPSTAGAYRDPKAEICVPQAGFVAQYARHADYHDVLGARLKELKAFVDELGGTGTHSLWYVDTGPILEREFAERAGVGFVGKHTNVISRRFGNWILLGEILTTLDLEPDAPEKNHCGTCTRCLDCCPTRALTAPFRLDARLCISYLTIELKGAIPVELRPAIGNRIFGCDDCLAVCPWNRFARESQLMQASARPELRQLDLLELLTLDETEFKRRFARTPLIRVKLRGLRRNVCVALGNVGDETHLPALQAAGVDTDALVAEHARWAIDQISVRHGSRA
jgi:epoxyqueuosine reductase